MTTPHEVICTKCNTVMVTGVAILNTWVTGVPDFGTSPPRGTPIEEVPKELLIGQTINVGGSGKLIDCLKCPECGYSINETKHHTRR